MPPIGTTQGFDIAYRDATDELGRMKVYTNDITAASIAGFLSELGAFETATDAITLGVRAKSSWGADTTVSNSIPTDKAAQREAKLLVQYQDAATEEQFTLTVPTVDFSVLNFVPGGGDAVIFSGAGASSAIVAWVTAFEAIAASPRDELATVEVVGMRFVGRNT